MKPSLTADQARLLRALVLYLSKDDKNLMRINDAANAVVVESITSEPWASLTFTGERHRLGIRLPIGTVEDVIDATALKVSHRIVAVAGAAWATTAGGVTLTLDVLVIDEFD